MEDIDEISDWFWDIIRRAEYREDKLREILMELDGSQVSRFLNEGDAAAVELMESPHTDYMETHSEDDIDYLARWVVSQGKEYYTQVLEHPELMPPDRDNREDPFSGVAVQVEYEKWKIERRHAS
jgi:hypothetical protein